MYYKFAKIVNLFKQNIFQKQNPPSNVKEQFSIIDLIIWYKNSLYLPLLTNVEEL